ncbi:unnamed protein product [Enterobius vermicularis]|uniref:Neur_chan_LBD domain-containing protein n=1 Tax=Enterobius vermicularis TaxID=51028 RepID=A0A0N4VR32_ENTVE|nr:unnamed protein product [Enterobius vermicularis]
MYTVFSVEAEKFDWKYQLTLLVILVTVVIEVDCSSNSKNSVPLDVVLQDLDDTTGCNRTVAMPNVHRLIDGTLQTRNDWPNFLEVAKILSDQTDLNVTLRKITNWRDKAVLLYKPNYLPNMSEPKFFLQLYCTTNSTTWIPVLAFPTKKPDFFLLLKPTLTNLDVCDYSQCKASKVSAYVVSIILISLSQIVGYWAAIDLFIV